MCEVAKEEFNPNNDELLIFQRVEKEYRYYQEIKKLIDSVAVAFEAIPDGLLVEVRAFTGHISDAIILKEDSLQDRLDNIKSAHNHLRRIALDCYKLLCIDGFKQIKEFKGRYKFFNLSSVDDGKFLKNLDDKLKKAKRLNKEAKALDKNGNNSKSNEDVEFGCLYDAYENAFNAYSDAVNYIEEHREGAIRLAGKSCFWKAMGFLGWVISIGVSIALYVLQSHV